jgi:D-alanyl-D-alanine endopeptidase (penicillin-binding protein 7)
MRTVFQGACRRGALALFAGFIVLHLHAPADAAERKAATSTARKAADVRPVAAPAKRVAAPAKRAAAPTSSARPAAGARSKAVVPPRAVPAAAQRPSAKRPASPPVGSAAASSRASRAVAARPSAGPARGTRVVKASFAPRAVEPARLSIGQAIGLHMVDDPLDLRSSVAMVIDQKTGETLFDKNADAVLPIASITKVMTAMVVLDSGASLGDMLEVTEADRDTERHSGSRLPIGARLSRGEMLQLALMSSENRAANALGRHYPGGMQAFVAEMNAKARSIGMSDSRFSEPTGLSSNNVSNARDLARLVRAAHGYPLIRQYSTAADLSVDTGYRQVAFRSTNRLIDDPAWDIGLQKTGFISEAGKCLVLQARIDGRQVIIVLLDATATHFRFADAQRLRRWIAERPSGDTVGRLETRS